MSAPTPVATTTPVVEPSSAKKRKPSAAGGGAEESPEAALKRQAAADRRRAAADQKKAEEAAAWEAVRTRVMYRYWAFLVYIPAMFRLAEETVKNQYRLEKALKEQAEVAAVKLVDDQEWIERALFRVRVADEAVAKIRADQDVVHAKYTAMKEFCLARGMPNCATGIEIMMSFAGSYFTALEMTQRYSQREMDEVPDAFCIVEGTEHRRRPRCDEAHKYVSEPGKERRFGDLSEAMSDTGLKAVNAPWIIIEKMRDNMDTEKYFDLHLRVKSTPDIVGYDVCAGASLKPPIRCNFF